MRIALHLAGIALLCLGQAAAAPLALPPAPDVQFAPSLGARLPLDVAVQASDGSPTLLARYFDGRRAVVLVPGYYRCTQLCGLVMHGLLEALDQTGLPASGWRVVGFSIDPADTPASAHSRRDDDLAYARFIAANGPSAGQVVDAQPAPIDLLVAAPAGIDTLSRALGLDARPGADGGTDHAAGFVVATPDGHLSRHFAGVRFEPRALRLALVEASQGRIGTLTDRLVLLCSHYDPVVGRYTTPVMFGLRALGLLGLLAGAAWMWRRRHASRGTA